MRRSVTIAGVCVAAAAGCRASTKPAVLFLCVVFGFGALRAQTSGWQPSPGHTQLALWPGVPPDAQPVPGPETTTVSSKLIGGKTVTGVYNVTRPTLTVYAPKGVNTGAAIVVFPGGGFEELAI